MFHMEQKERAVIYRSFPFLNILKPNPYSRVLANVQFQTPFTLIITQAQTVYILYKLK